VIPFLFAFPPKSSIGKQTKSSFNKIESFESHQAGICGINIYVNFNNVNGKAQITRPYQLPREARNNLE
jgi:hypothetical protein